MILVVILIILVGKKAWIRLLLLLTHVQKNLRHVRKD